MESRTQYNIKNFDGKSNTIARIRKKYAIICGYKIISKNMTFKLEVDIKYYIVSKVLCVFMSLL